MGQGYDSWCQWLSQHISCHNLPVIHKDQWQPANGIVLVKAWFKGPTGWQQKPVMYGILISICMWKQDIWLSSPSPFVLVAHLQLFSHKISFYSLSKRLIWNTLADWFSFLPSPSSWPVSHCYNPLHQTRSFKSTQGPCFSRSSAWGVTAVLETETNLCENLHWKMQIFWKF